MLNLMPRTSLAAISSRSLRQMDRESFEFYLTNRDTTYLVCFNHHDFLIGTGEATQWRIFHAR